MPPKKVTKKTTKSKVIAGSNPPKFIILKNINPLKLIYEHLLVNIENKTKDVLQYDAEGYVDHIIQDSITITTNLSDILKESSTNYTIFNDIRKNPIKGWPTLIDSTNKEFNYNKLTKIKCWWCKNSFDNYPLGIPLKLKNNLQSSNTKCDTILHLQVEGVVCSFCCGKSYIVDTTTKIYGSRYKDSLSLLNWLFNISKQNSIEIPFAPHWNLLQDFGGHLTINEFRASFGKIKYIPTPNILQTNHSILYCEQISN